MIAALLNGRSHLTTSEFSNQQHLLFFSHILGIIDQLRPHIFQQDKVHTSDIFTLTSPFLAKKRPEEGRGMEGEERGWERGEGRGRGEG